MSEASDSELMRGYAEGDAGAFDELFQRYEQRVYRFFRRRTSEERAADLYQELFLRLHRFRDRFDPDRPFAPWLFRIARHVLVDDFRRALGRPEEALDAAAAEPVPAPDAERRAADRELAGRLLGSLSADQAGVVVAAKVEGVEYADLARQLGRSVDAVKQTASRALRRLRALAAETG